MTSNRKFYVTGDDGTGSFLSSSGFQKVHTPEEADLIVFCGGEDIATEIYGEKPVMARIPLKRSGRDLAEQELFHDYVGLKMFLGICRGAQYLNCLSGGKLWQHVDNHGRSHNIQDVRTKDIYEATSTHHQMMRPAKAAEMIAVAHLSDCKLADGISLHQRLGHNMGDDVEIVWYPTTQALCIQGHPEYVPGSPFANYCLKLIEDYANVKQEA